MEQSSVNIGVVVVLYNTSCENSPTCKALFKNTFPGIKILIYDNSTVDKGNRAQCRDRDWVYLGGEGNKGLSVAYNACIDYLRNMQFQGVICLFDDDTHLESAYFEAVQEAHLQNPNAICLPVIESAGTILSPCILHSNFRSERFPNEQALRSYQGNELTAINSGMAIPFSIFQGYRYDENIFLDGIDHRFILDMKEQSVPLQIMNYRCSHDFSGDSKPSLQAALARFRIFVKDSAYLYRNKKSIYWYLAGKRALRLAVNYRKLEFLKIAFLKV